MRTVFLSHVLSEETPLYGGQGKIKIITDKSIASGDSCNTSIIEMPAHCGTHVDAPYHFHKEGKCIDDLEPDDWTFSVVSCLEFSLKPGELIWPEHLRHEKALTPETDLILFKSGFEEYRDEETYWRSAPGIVPEMAEVLIEKCPGLKAVGMDFISISSLMHREKGREAHRAFLQKGILLFEDMSLKRINATAKIQSVIALPLRFSRADGSPVTIVAYLD